MIPDPTNKIYRIPNCTSDNFSDSGFHKQKIPGYRNPYSPKWGDMKKKSYKVVLSCADFYHAVQGGSIILL